MKPISPFGLPIGISITFWALIGLLRLLSEKWYIFQRKIQKKREPYSKLKPKDIAVLLPAHNEELIIRSSIAALKLSLHAKQIYVVSDGSVDKTYRRARMEGCHVSRLHSGRGKARALVYLIEQFKLDKKYKLLFIVDADTRIDKDCVRHALPLFNDPGVGVVFATSKIIWPQHFVPRLRYYFIAYRDRLNRMLQYFMIYGQTWKYTNVNYVIPGFATIYRSEVLKRLEIDTPGLVIEDFNLAFQFHKKHLGTIGYSPMLIGWDQYPDNLTDYWKQVRRWNIGFFQTVRKNGIWPSFFWLSLGVFSIEVIFQSAYLILLPLLVLSLILPFIVQSPLIDEISRFYLSYGPFTYLTLADIILGIFVIDYILTVLIGMKNKRPQYYFYGLFFFFMHYVTSLILLSSIIPGFFSSSSGRWTSPKRLAVRK